MTYSSNLRRWLPWLFGVSFLGLGGFVPFLALILRERGIDGWTLAAALAAVPLSRLVAGPLWSILADQWQAPGRVVRLGAIVTMAGAIALWFAPENWPWFVVFSIGVLSIGRASAGPVIDSLALKHLPDRLAYGRQRRWGSLGFMVGVVIVGWMVDHTRWGPIEALAFASLVFLVLTFAMPRSPGVERVALGPALRSLSRDPFIRWILPGASLHFAPHVGNTSFLAVHMDGLGHGGMWTGVAIAGGVILEVLLMGGASPILTRVGAGRLLLVSMALSIPRWILMVWVTSPLAITAVNTLHGITFGMFWIAAVTLLNERVPDHITTSAQGILSGAVGGVGSLMGMVGASLIVTHWGTLMLYEVSTFMGVAGLCCAVMALRQR